jgi:hypothetical protein
MSRTCQRRYFASALLGTAACLLSCWFACAPAPRPRTLPAAAASTHAPTRFNEDTATRAVPAGLELVSALKGPYRNWTARDWDQFFRISFGSRPVDVGARDALVADLARVVSSRPPGTECGLLVLEAVTGGMSLEYARVMAAHVEGPEAAALGERLAALDVRVLARQPWQLVEREVRAMNQHGGRNVAGGWVHDWTEIMVVTWYAGDQWTVATWYWPWCGYLEDKEFRKTPRDKRPPDVGASVELLCILNEDLKPPLHFPAHTGIQELARECRGQ